MRFTQIVCPIDFSEHAREAMRTAMSIAAADSRVTLVHVYSLPVIGPPEMPIDPTLVEMIIENAENGVREWAAEAIKLGPAHVEAVCLQGVAWNGIVEVARERAANLIVMGTQGRTGLKHALVGSVAERVLRHAHCPVLVVRAAKP